MEKELQLQNFVESEWEEHNNYYYKNTRTGKIIHEETFNKKLQRAFVWEQAVEYVSEELQELVYRWMSSEKPEYEVAARELQSKLEELQ